MATSELNNLMEQALKDRSFDFYETGYPIKDKISKQKIEYIQAMTEDIELFRKYVDKENEYRALKYIVENVLSMRIDIPVFSSIFHKCENGQIVSSEDVPIDSEKLNGLRWTTKNKLKLAYRLEAIWSNFDILSPQKREGVLNHTFTYEIHKVGEGWESAKITVDGEIHYCDISDIGNTADDFEEFVRDFKDGNTGYFSWSTEPGSHTWLLSRRDPYIYAEIPGFSKGKFFYREGFFRIICQNDFLLL